MFGEACASMQSCRSYIVGLFQVVFLFVNALSAECTMVTWIILILVAEVDAVLLVYHQKIAERSVDVFGHIFPMPIKLN